MDIKSQAASILSKLISLNKNQIINLIEIPPDSKLGDLAFPCFILSKKLKKNPGEIAMQIRKKLAIPKSSIFKKVEIAGPYLNFFVDEGKYAAEILKQVSKNYGKSNKGKNKKLIIEHTSTNPSGPTHVGRIRNSFIGDTLVRLYKAIGYNVETHYYVNDMGKQIAIINWGIKNKIKTSASLIKKFSKYKNNPDFKIMFVYVTAMKLVEKNPKLMKEIDDFLIAAENNKQYASELNKVAKTCLEGQKKMLARFGINFDEFDFESDLVAAGEQKKIANKLKALPEYKILEEGAHAVDLSKYGFERRGGGTVFLRANGTSVYITRDLAYHKYKLSLADKNIIVLGEDHKIEAVELKKLLEIFGILKSKTLDVVFLSFVNFDKVKISTRSGTTLPADAILDEGIEKIISKKKTPLKLAEKIAVGAIRYFELRVSPTKQISFNWDEVLSLEGNTGPYLQYALVRSNKILQKSEAKPSKASLELLVKPYEFELVKKIALFPEIVEKAADSYSPQLVANYAYELAQLFSSFYENCPVIRAEKKLQGARLALVKAFAHTLKNALNLLGIEEVAEM